MIKQRTMQGRAFSPLGPTLRALGALVRLWLDLWSERQSLERLDDRMLADIGVSREEARQEASRAPWDRPQGRSPNGWH